MDGMRGYIYPRDGSVLSDCLEGRRWGEGFNSLSRAIRKNWRIVWMWYLFWGKLLV